MKFMLNYFVLITLLLITSCTVGPKYHTPKIESSNKWFTSPAATKTTNSSLNIDTEWWKNLKDPDLNYLIARAVQNNLDIKIAEARIRKAIASRQMAASSFFPFFSASSTAQKAGGIYQGSPPYNNYANAISSNWQIDLFGTTRNAVEAADARIGGSEAEKRGIFLSLLSTIAQNYIDLRGVQARIVITNQNIELQRQTVKLISQQLTAGESNMLDLANAEAQLQTTESTLHNLISNMRATIHTLSNLVGEEPQVLLEILLETKPLPQISSKLIPIGLRSDILRRRPDVQQAERNLAASNSDVGVAIAGLFPQFSLTGNVTFSTLLLPKLFSSAQQSWLFGPTLQLPLFSGGNLRANITAQEENETIAALNYKKTVIAALADTESALVKYGQALKTEESLDNATKKYQQAFNISQQRYKAGEVNMLDLLSVNQNLLKSKDQLLSAQISTLLQLVSLYKSLGGGYQVYSK